MGFSPIYRFISKIIQDTTIVHAVALRQLILFIISYFGFTFTNAWVQINSFLFSQRDSALTWTKSTLADINIHGARYTSSASCTGFLCGSASFSRLRLLSTGHCPATPLVTWPTTVSSSPTPVTDNCILPTLEHLLSVRRAAVLETGPLPPQDQKSGKVCRPISDYVGCHPASTGGFIWRHFYSDSELF